MRLATLNALLLLGAGTAQAQKVECTDPATGDRKTIVVGRVQENLQAARRTMKKYSVHILDLSEALQERHQYLQQFLDEKNWCVVNTHALALETALSTTHIDQSFVADKFSRVERWARVAVTQPERQTRIERMMATAAAQMSDRRFEQANALLTDVIALIFGSPDTWKLPAELPAPPDGDGKTVSTPKITTAEVQAGCPALAKAGRANREELEAAIDRLGKLMDSRSLRPLDIKGGEALIGDLASYRRLAATWPAARIVCAMLDRVGQVEIDLGVVSKRFHRVKNLHEGKPLAGDGEERFRELVRTTSQAIIDSRFAEAHTALEALLVMLGEPARPSATLP
jgi:hypothetical protein